MVVVILVATAVLALGPRRLIMGSAKRAERAWLILSGKLVDAGGHRLRIERSGTGSPTVILESGLAQTRSTWGTVPANVSLFTQVITYDRAGLGESDPGPIPRTSREIVEDLHNVLVNSGTTGPFILVGHSFGGLTVRLFANKYSDQVAGLVLVDASHEDEYSRVAALMSEPDRDKYLRHEGGDNYERVNLLASADQVRKSGGLRQMPIVVLSAPGTPHTPAGPRGVQLHEELQFRLLSLVAGITQAKADNSSHFIQLDRPDLVTGAIRKMVEQSRPKA